MASNYFNNNKIMNATSIPTEGTFKVGDIIVNIGENVAEEPMWICVEAGSPGVWEICSGADPNAISAIEYTDGIDIQIDGGEIGNMSELATNDKSSIVAAINELFQSANNGKELIASVIGEPLSAEQTFNAMSNDINSLLTTFKINMMNNGVSVAANDKFKQLIDKISTIVEEGQGKGIQFASGVLNGISSGDLRDPSDEYLSTGGIVELVIPIDIDFTPSKVVLYADTLYYNNHLDNIFLDNEVRTNDMQQIEVYNNFDYSMKSWSNANITLSLNYYIYLTTDYQNVTLNNIHWYAIGVGENEGGGGLDIISATELPATGKENQICVITDSSVDQFVITPNNGYRPTDKIVLHTPDHNNNEYNYAYTASNVTYLLNITRAGLGNTNLASYYYNNGWQPLTYVYFPLIENGMIASNAIGSNLYTAGSYFAFISGTVPYARLYSGGTGIVHTRTTSKIDFGLYNKVTVRCQATSAIANKFWLGCFGDGVSNGAGSYSANDFSPLCTFCSNILMETTTNEQVLTFDISSWYGTYYLSFGKSSNASDIYIYDILLYK